VANLTVTASNLNLRVEPDLKSEVICVLNHGDIVEWLETSSNNYWQKIQINGKVGWASCKYLRVESSEEDATIPRWFYVAIDEYNKHITEVVGKLGNPRIIEYLHSTNLDSNAANSDETPWCSAFVNWCVEKSGYAGTESAWARSWLKWGKAIEEPSKGCIVVFERGIDAGHVAFFVSKISDSEIEVLGGNQGNKVCIKSYPINKLLGYRCL
jgi:uncharacterized protein (TIGR02594 family)